MTRKERLWRTLRGEAVDRPAVNFYEIGGFLVQPEDSDPYNIYHSPDWQPLLRLAEESTDLIRMIKPRTAFRHADLRARHVAVRTWEEGRSRFKETAIRGGGGRVLREVTRRDADVDTVWTLEHFLKDEADAAAWLELPDELFACDCDVSLHLQEEVRLGERGIVMVDFPDPLSRVAKLMAMDVFTVTAFTEPELTHRLLARAAQLAHAEAESVARQFPGHLWRLTGAEYATEPYLSPQHFRDYWLAYARPLIELIHASGGLARVHAHGRIRSVLGAMVEAGADAIDPIEPPHQGDMELNEVRDKYGDRLVLFGNLEIADIEGLPPEAFREKVTCALAQGVGGKGFVLMPSASPYGRTISASTLRNYENMVEMTS